MSPRTLTVPFVTRGKRGSAGGPVPDWPGAHLAPPRAPPLQSPGLVLARRPPPGRWSGAQSCAPRPSCAPGPTMGNSAGRSDFEWVYTDQPHTQRRKEMLGEHAPAPPRGQPRDERRRGPRARRALSSPSVPGAEAPLAPPRPRVLQDPRPGPALRGGSASQPLHPGPGNRPLAGRDPGANSGRRDAAAQGRPRDRERVGDAGRPACPAHPGPERRAEAAPEGRERGTRYRFFWKQRLCPRIPSGVPCLCSLSARGRPSPWFSVLGMVFTDAVADAGHHHRCRRLHPAPVTREGLRVKGLHVLSSSYQMPPNGPHSSRPASSRVGSLASTCAWQTFKNWGLAVRLSKQYYVIVGLTCMYLNICRNASLAILICFFSWVGLLLDC